MTIHPIYLTRHFSLDELTYSRTADIKGITNLPAQPALDNLIYLCESILQPLRDAIGPVHVTSGYRGPELNKEIGGSDTSQHSQGLAVDIYSDSLDNYELANFIRKHFDFDQLILEKVPKSNPRKGWVHVSIDRVRNRKEVLSYVKDTKEESFKYTLGLQYTNYL